MPLVDPSFLDFLFERVAGHDAAVARLEDGRFQPVQAVYRTEAMAAACADVLDRGDRRLHDALFELEYTVVDSETVDTRSNRDTFENVNDRADLERVARKVAARST